MQDPQAAAKEIDRLGSRPDIVQILFSAGSRMPYGQQFYDPIWEACERNGLVAGMHFGGIDHEPADGGWVAFLLSRVAHRHVPGVPGTGDQSRLRGNVPEVPRLKFALIEGGFAWMPHVMWRLDKNWKALRSECPWLTRKPSELIRNTSALRRSRSRSRTTTRICCSFEMMDAEHILMFSSDYPHWDFDSPQQAFPRLPADLKRRIFSENARELYGL